MSESLKCDICGAPATIHLTQILDGEVSKVHLCEKCATKHDATDLPIMKFAEMLTKKILSGKFGKKKSGKFVPAKIPEKTCPNCGLTNLEFEKIQRFGCEQCYKTFAKEIAELLPKIQKSVIHAGTVPAKVADAAKPKRHNIGKMQVPELSIGQLRELLANAVAHEDYKLAAKTRDIIRAREQEKSAGTPPARTKKATNTRKKSQKKQKDAGK